MNPMEGMGEKVLTQIILEMSEALSLRQNEL